MILSQVLVHSVTFYIFTFLTAPIGQLPDHAIIRDIQGPVMTFEKSLHDFGDVRKGEKREFTFIFTNTGDADLLIEIGSACDCTTLDWPRRPVPPGGRGEIPIIFDSSSKEGEITIDIDLIANTDPILNIIQFKANVIKD